MSTAQEFISWLLQEGYVEKLRQDTKKVWSVADANSCVSLQHPDLGWAHVSEFVRGSTVRVECILHPQLLGERTVHRELASAQPRLAALKKRIGHSGVYIENPKRDPWLKRKT